MTLKLSVAAICIREFISHFKHEILGWSNVQTGGAVASWLVRSTPERAVQVQALAGDIALCS